MTLKTVRTALLATAFAIGGASYAMAQSSPAPANQSGGGVSATTPSPTDLSKTGDNTMGRPAAGARHTTGSGHNSGMNNSMNNSMHRGKSASEAHKESLEKTRSPASHDSGVKQQK